MGADFIQKVAVSGIQTITVFQNQSENLLNQVMD